MAKDKAPMRKPGRKPDISGRVTLSPRESIRITRFGLNFTYDLLNSGEMPAFCLGKRYLIPKEALLHWLATGENPLKKLAAARSARAKKKQAAVKSAA